MKMKRSLGALCVLMAGLLLPAICQAAGTTTGTFLNLGVSARSEAMGGAYTAMSSDASSVTINPAGMLNVEGQQVSLMHNEYLLDINQEYFSYVSSWGKKAYGASLIYVDYGSQIGTTATNVVTGTFNPTSYALSFAYGAKASDMLAYGVAVKYVNMKIDTYSDSTFALDAGVQYKPGFQGLTLAAVVSHLGGGLRFYQSEDPLPLTLKLGAAYDWEKQPLTTTFDLYIIRHEDPEYHLGLQYIVSEIVPVRLGYNSDDDLDDGLTYGIGVIQPNFSLDYAFIPGGNLGDTNRFSLLFNF